MGPRTTVDSVEKRKDFPPARNRTQSSGYPADSLVTILTKLSQFLLVLAQCGKHIILIFTCQNGIGTVMRKTSYEFVVISLFGSIHHM
jgi:hypothetical protein